jgi:predicted lactoylglutathione lyase
MASKLIFLNIPVSDLESAKKFYLALGFTQNTMFSDASTICIVVSEHIHVMLHEHDRFSTWVPKSKSIADAHTSTEVLICISADSKDEVDTYIKKAAEAGGKADVTKLPEEGGMYGRSFEDLDGHVWEIGYMDMSQMPKEGTE